MNSDAEQLANKLLQHTREDLARADTKASILLAVAGVVVGALFAAAIGDSWTPADLALVPETIAWLAIILLIAGLVLLGIAVCPRIKVHHPDRLTYFGQARTITTSAALEIALQAEAARPRSRDAEQLWALSRTVWVKYRLTQVAVFCGGGALALGIVAALIDLAT